MNPDIEGKYGSQAKQPNHRSGNTYGFVAANFKRFHAPGDTGFQQGNCRGKSCEKQHDKK